MARRRTVLSGDHAVLLPVTIAFLSAAVFCLTVPHFADLRNMLNIFEQLGVLGFGVAIAYGRMIPFIVTLSTMILAQGFAIWYTQAQSVYGLPNDHVDLISGRIFGVIPMPAVLILIIALITGPTLARTQYGRWIYLTGTNEQTGIDIRRTKFSTYVLSGLMAGVTAIVGEKQFVEIARALATGAEIVIFVEPTPCLSIKEKSSIFDTIRRLKSEGKTIIYISHFLDEIIELCDGFFGP